MWFKNEIKTCFRSFNLVLNVESPFGIYGFLSVQFDKEIESGLTLPKAWVSCCIFYHRSVENYLC